MITLPIKSVDRVAARPSQIANYRNAGTYVAASLIKILGCALRNACIKAPNNSQVCLALLGSPKRVLQALKRWLLSESDHLIYFSFFLDFRRDSVLDIIESFLYRIEGVPEHHFLDFGVSVNISPHQYSVKVRSSSKFWGSFPSAISVSFPIVPNYAKLC